MTQEKDSNMTRRMYVMFIQMWMGWEIGSMGSKDLSWAPCTACIVDGGPGQAKATAAV
jgi:hypothetical protein